MHGAGVVGLVYEVHWRPAMQAATDGRGFFQWEMATGERPALIWKAEPPESEIRFELKHRLPQAISGQATRWKAFAGLDFEEPSRSWVDVAIDATSLETGDTDRDGLIRSAEVLDAGSFPEILFNSTEVTAVAGRSRWTVAGDLTIRHVTLPATMELDLAAVDGPNLVALSGRMAISRRQLDLGRDQNRCRDGTPVGNDIELTIRLVAHRAHSH
jgi:polyisoprenoid-binding protein YceI